MKFNAYMKKNLTGYLLLIPALIVFGLMIIFPFVNSIIYSFTDKHLIFIDYKFIGLGNYNKLFADPNFFKLLLTSVIFMLFATAAPFLLGFIWAIVMNTKFRSSEFFRGLTLVNWIVPGIAIGFLWSWIFNGDYGVLNGILAKFGIISKYITWLGNSQTALAVIIIARTWQMFPWYMAFILGGLQGVSTEQLEAARIDGADNMKVFFSIVLPSVMPVVSLIIIMGIIGNLQHFDLIKVMTNGGPANSTATFAVEVYKKAFEQWEIGRAAALGVVWAAALALFSFVYIRRAKEE